MILSGYGIKLVRIRQEHIELVRHYRNTERIRSFMEYRDEITPEMQAVWFQQINNRNHGFFLIEYANEFIGVVNGKDIDWEKKITGSGGVFIWNESWWNTTIPVAAVLLFIDTSFLLGLERTYIRVLRDNDHAIRFNRSLGYVLLDGQEEVVNQEYVLTHDAYFSATTSLRRILQRQWGNTFTCVIADPEEDAAKNILRIAAQFTAAQQALLRVTVDA
jgi:RimJ/RimL family protein N-acetyltransferase